LKILLKKAFSVRKFKNYFIEKHHQKVGEKFDKEINTMERFKLREKNVILKKKLLLKSIQENTGNKYQRMLQQQDQGQ
jgi:hypothetical protein